MNHAKPRICERRAIERKASITTKEKLRRAVDDLPDDATIEDAMERFLFLAKVERGLKQADAGETIAHDQVREKVARWLK